MPTVLRYILGLGSFLFIVFLLVNIKKSRFSIDLSIIWILIGLVVILLSIFPNPIIKFMNFIGIQSAVNGVFLSFIAICLVLIFYLYKRVSNLEQKIIELIQRIGINNKNR